MSSFLAWLQSSVLGHAMRESGVWMYGIVNLIHILGVAALFGSVLVLDLRLLGVWRRVELAAISAPTVRMAGLGFGVAAISGAGLLATKASEYAGNPFLYIKFVAIGLGLVNVAVLNGSRVWRDHKMRILLPSEQSRLALFGGISLFCWFTAISAGRMIGYW